MTSQTLDGYALDDSDDFGEDDRVSRVRASSWRRPSRAPRTTRGRSSRA
jgi:hypothetical protein